MADRSPNKIWQIPENVELLKKLHAAGVSCSQIASKIPFATRNAIIGKLHRLGLGSKDVTKTLKKPRKDRGVRRVPLHANSQPLHHKTGSWAPKPGQQPYQEATTMPQVDDGVSPLHPRVYRDLEYHMCHWPLYLEQGVQMYCASDIGPDGPRGGVYCATHRAMAAQPPKSRKIHLPFGRR